jgi:DNA-binding transcriptional LysR family regulator
MTDRLDSRSLRQFVAVAETLSFRQAAETLHISQPPLSRAIRQLEERLGTPLFERNTQSVTITPAGQRLLPLARRILRLIEEAQEAVSAQHVPARLRIGVTSAIESQWFQKVTRAMEAEGVKPVVSSDTSPRLVRLLTRAQLDAAFIALPTHAPNLEVDVLEKQPLIAVLPAGHRLARRRIISLEELSADALFWFQRARQPAFFDHCRAVFDKHGYAPTLLEEPKDHHVLLAAVASGRGVALLPASFAAIRRNGVIYKPLREGTDLYVGIGLATSSDRRDVREFLLRIARAGLNLLGDTRRARDRRAA